MKRQRKINRVIIFLTLLLYILSGNQLNSITSSPKESSILIINPGSPDSGKYLKNWNIPLSDRSIYYWGRSKGIYLIDDSGPVVDNIAGFVSEFGSEVRISGLKRDCYYRMWIDFVKFFDPKERSFPSKLNIYIQNNNSKNRLISTLLSEDLDENEPYIVDIPYELTVKGAILVTFEENSIKNGFWGIWDIVVSDKKRGLSESRLPIKKK